MIFLATTGSGIARAADERGSWTVAHVLAGQDVRCLAADPLQPRTVYAGTQGEGVLRSDDSGLTWRPAGFHGRVVKSLAVSPLIPDVIYAGLKPVTLFVSRDGGGSWAELPSLRRARRWWWFSPAEPPFTPYVQALALSPTDPNVLLVGIEAGAVVRSMDGGATWSDHRPGALRDCHSLVFHATDGRWAYQGGAWMRSGGAAVSRTAGERWTAPRECIDRTYGWAVAADPAQPEVWYVSVAPGIRAHGPRADAAIFRSAGGAPWQRLAGGLPEPLHAMPYALLTDPAAPGHLYAGLSNGEIWHSRDHGDVWTQLPINLGSIHRSLIRLS